MATFSQKATRLVLVAALWGLSAVAVTRPVAGQTPDPYRPYNSGYDSFVYPTYPNATGFYPNEGAVLGGTGFANANNFEAYMSDAGLGSRFDDERVPGPRRTGPGVPYYSAYRRYDRDYDRVYQPNKKVDPDFYDDQRARHEKYLAYLKETNPRKRAQLYREYITEARMANLGLSRASTAARPGRGTNTSSDLFGTSGRATSGRGSSAAPYGSGTGAGSSLLDPRGTSRSSSSSVDDILRRSRALDPTRRGATTTKPATSGSSSTTTPAPR